MILVQSLGIFYNPPVVFFFFFHPLYPQIKSCGSQTPYFLLGGRYCMAGGNACFTSAPPWLCPDPIQKITGLGGSGLASQGIHLSPPCWAWREGWQLSQVFVANWSGLVTKGCPAGVTASVTHFQLTKDLDHSPWFKVVFFFLFFFCDSCGFWSWF